MSHILFLIWKGCRCFGKRRGWWGGGCWWGTESCNSRERRQGNTNRKHHVIQDQVKKWVYLHQALLHLALQSTPNVITPILFYDKIK